MITFGVALFAGGKSRRMGQDKAALTLEGKPFLYRVAGELECFDEKLLSLDDAARYPDLAWRHVADRKENCGPLGGLCTVLAECRSDALLVATCDLPLYRGAFAAWLCEQLEEPWDAVVPVTEDGMHPMCAVYRKRCLAVLERQLAAGDYRIRAALEQLNVCYVPAGEWSDVLLNVNTPEEYKALLERTDTQK